MSNGCFGARLDGSLEHGRHCHRSGLKSCGGPGGGKAHALWTATRQRGQVRAASDSKAALHLLHLPRASGSSSTGATSSARISGCVWTMSGALGARNIDDLDVLLREGILTANDVMGSSSVTTGGRGAFCAGRNGLEVSCTTLLTLAFLTGDAGAACSRLSGRARLRCRCPVLPSKERRERERERERGGGDVLRTPWLPHLFAFFLLVFCSSSPVELQLVLFAFARIGKNL